MSQRFASCIVVVDNSSQECCCAGVALQLRDANHLGTITDVKQQPTLLAVAALFPARDQGTVRLIDNTVLNV